MITWINSNISNLLFFGFVLCIGIYYRNKGRKHNELFSSIIKTLNIVINNNEMKELGADIELLKKVLPKENKQKMTINFLADKIPKGYDFIYCENKSTDNCEITVHRHKKSNEFVFVLKGEIKLAIYNKQGLIEKSKSLKEMDWFYIRSGKFHELLYSLPGTQYIVVAKPPILYKVGSLYEKIISRFSKRNKKAKV